MSNAWILSHLDLYINVEEPEGSQVTNTGKTKVFNTYYFFIMAVMNYGCYYCEQIDKVQKKRKERHYISLCINKIGNRKKSKTHFHTKRIFLHIKKEQIIHPL